MTLVHADIPVAVFNDFIAHLSDRCFSQADRMIAECPALFELGPRYAKTTWAHYGCLQGSSDIVFWALKHGVHIDHIDSENRTPLMDAVFRGKEDIVEALLDAGANPNAVAPATKERAIHLAAESDFMHRSLKLLIARGASLEHRTPDADGKTALFIAIENRAVNNVNVLLGAGADHLVKCCGVDLLEQARLKASSSSGNKILAMLDACEAQRVIEQVSTNSSLGLRRL